MLVPETYKRGGIDNNGVVSFGPYLPKQLDLVEGQLSPADPSLRAEPLAKTRTGTLFEIALGSFFKTSWVRPLFRELQEACVILANPSRLRPERLEALRIVSWNIGKALWHGQNQAEKDIVSTLFTAVGEILCEDSDPVFRKEVSELAVELQQTLTRTPQKEVLEILLNELLLKAFQSEEREDIKLSYIKGLGLLCSQSADLLMTALLDHNPRIASAAAARMNEMLEQQTEYQSVIVSLLKEGRLGSDVSAQLDAAHKPALIRSLILCKQPTYFTSDYVRKIICEFFEERHRSRDLESAIFFAVENHEVFPEWAKLIISGEDVPAAAKDFVLKATDERARLAMQKQWQQIFELSYFPRYNDARQEWELVSPAPPDPAITQLRHTVLSAARKLGEGFFDHNLSLILRQHSALKAREAQYPQATGVYRKMDEVWKACDYLSFNGIMQYGAALAEVYLAAKDEAEHKEEQG